MELFNDRLPFNRNQIALSVLLAEHGDESPPVLAQPLTGFLDTGFAGEAFGWRHHLELAGLDPAIHLFHRTETFRATLHADKPHVVPVRKAEIWLLSNLPRWHGAPFRLELMQGVAFRDESRVAGMSKLPRLIIGKTAFANVGTRAELDFGRGECSIWTPQAPTVV